MKLVALLGLSAILLTACNKNKDYVGNNDHTTNITGTRHWKGTHTGYLKELKNDGSYAATAFSKTIADTTFLVDKSDILTLSTFGLQLRHKVTDSMAGTMRFDTTLPQSQVSFLQYNFRTQKQNFEYHSIREWNAASGHNYEDHYILETL